MSRRRRGRGSEPNRFITVAGAVIAVLIIVAMLAQTCAPAVLTPTGV